MIRQPSNSIIIASALLCIVMATSIFYQTVALLFIIVVGLLCYAPLIYFAKRTGSISALYFSVMLILLRVITLPLVYLLRDDFTESGWTAIKQFDFSSYAFIQLVISDSCAVMLILIATLLIRSVVPRSLHILQSAPRVFINLNFLPNGVNNSKAIPFVLLFVLVNYLIFDFANANKIGITGIEPNPLPFRLSGIIYYYLKFLGPFMLFYIIKNSKSKLLVLMLSLFLIFVAISTLSRSTLAMWAIPIAFVAYRNCKSITLTVIVVILVAVASIFSGIGRNLMFIANGTSIDIDLAVSMLEVAEGVIERISVSEIVLAMASLVARLGGGQELILGAQTVFPGFDFSLKLLIQIFTDQNFGVDYQTLVMLTHGFIPLEGTVAGIAYSGYMLAFLNSGYIIFILFAFFSAAILNLNDAFRSKIWELTQNAKLANGICFVMNFIFFALFMISWYWFFAFFIFVINIVYKRLSGGQYGVRRLKSGGNR
jgi:hypothetical protein